jgi:hypothetical protein
MTWRKFHAKEFIRSKAAKVASLRLCSLCISLRETNKNPRCMAGILFYFIEGTYAFTLPFTLAITSSAMLLGAGE